MLAVPGADLASSGNGGPLFLYVVPERRPRPLDELKFLEKFASVLSEPEHTIVISNEMLEFGIIQKFVDLRDFCATRDAEIKIVYLVRDIAAHAFSAWRELTAHHGYTAEWDAFQLFYATTWMNIFDATFRKFPYIFSRENLLVANYSSLGRRATEWFFSTVGEDYATYKPAQEVNRSASLKSIALMLEFNRCLKDILGDADRPTLRAPFYAAVQRRLDPNETSERRVSLTVDEYQILKEKCQETVDRINAVYLPHDPIQIARPDEIGAPLKMPKLGLSARQVVRHATEKIVADSKRAPYQHDSLVTRLDEILGSTQLFAES